MKSFLALLCCLPALLASAKDSQTALPPLPAGYTSKLALADLTSAGDPVASNRLRSWFFHHCFGGERPRRFAVEQPRLAQAVWLALTTQALTLGQISVAEAEAHLEHFQRQKALPSVTVDFFLSLWSQKPIRADRVPDFLRGSLESQAITLDATEQTAVRSAVASGCITLSFLEKKLNAPQSTPKR
jgi:hypothetical protein